MPTLKALLAQAFGWLAVIALLSAGTLPADSLLGLALFQGGLAAGAALLLKCDPWWLAIHLGFAPALVLASRLDIQPGWFLGAFLLLALVYWSSFRTQVPLYLTNRPTARALEDIVRQEGARSFADLGCGSGGVLRHLARALPECGFLGIESAPLPWLVARMITRTEPNCVILRDDFWRHSLSGVDVVYAFLSPVPMPRLAEKALAEMKPGSLLVSNSFPIPDLVADETRVVSDRRKTRLFLYRMPGQN